MYLVKGKVSVNNILIATMEMNSKTESINTAKKLAKWMRKFLKVNHPDAECIIVGVSRVSSK